MSHLSYNQLADSLQNIYSQIPLDSHRFHYKNPTIIYTIVDIVIDEATDTPAVIYQKLWDTQNIKFVRLASIFLELVGDQQRFQYIKTL